MLVAERWPEVGRGIRKVSRALTTGFALRSNRERFFKAEALRKEQARGALRVLGTLMSERIARQKTAPTKRLLALGLTITLSFSAICGWVLWHAGDRDYLHSRAAAANLVSSLASEIDRNIERRSPLLQRDGIGTDVNDWHCDDLRSTCNRGTHRFETRR